MRSSVSTHLALALATLSAGAVLPHAAAAAPIEVTATTSKLALPADAANYSDLSNIFSRAPYLGASGQLMWLYGRQRTLDDAKAIGTVSGEGTGGPLSLGTVERSVALRDLSATSISGLGLPGGLAAVQGGQWFVDQPRTPRPARSRLVQFDDVPRVIARRTAPKSVTFEQPVATSRGMRILAYRDRANRTRTDTTRELVIVDGSRIRTQPYLSTLRAAAALPDGSLLVAGTSKAAGNLPDPVLRITRSGKVSRLADRRRLDAAQTTGLSGIVATEPGLFMSEQPGVYDDTNAGADFKTALVLRGPTGKVVARKLIRELDMPRPAGCDQKPTLVLGALAVGPDGLPVARMACWADVLETTPWNPQGYVNRQFRGSLVVGLNADLSVRWFRRSSEGGDGAPNSRCGGDTVISDGRLVSIDCNGLASTLAVPGALPVTRGKLLSTRRDGKAGAVARIRCQGAPGSVCSGLVEISQAGRVVGTAAYALPGRPGAAAASITRHVPTPRPLAAKYTVRLRAAQ